MKVIIEMSPSEAVMLNDHVNDLLLAASNEEMKQTTQLEGPKSAKKRKAQKQDDDTAPTPLPIPELVIVPATQPVPTAVPIQAAPQVPVAAPIPTAAPRVFTLPEIAAASAQLRDAGKLSDLTALLAQFGVQAVTELAADQLQLFAQQLIAMGARL